jgi:hypothetical protein
MKRIPGWRPDPLTGCPFPSTLTAMNDQELRRMTREQLDDLLAQVMFRLRQFDAQDLQQEMQTKSQKLSMGLAKRN